MTYCKYCRQMKPSADVYTSGKYFARCKTCNNSPRDREYRKQYMRQIRVTTISKYGGKCACCGETEPKFLAIDHINGGGVKHKKELIKQGLTLYLFLRQSNYPQGFQVLCHNCNLSKGFYGSCPHKTLVSI